MIRLAYMEQSMADSFSFSSLKDMIVVSIGFDKSDTDFIGTWRVCNRRSGNSSVYVQSFACLEGPVAEHYENEVRTIGNPEFPIEKVVRSLINDQLYCVAISTPNAKSCACLVFKAIPGSAPLSDRKIEIVLRNVVVPKEAVE